jgi:hypothetical protein
MTVHIVAIGNKIFYATALYAWLMFSSAISRMLPSSNLVDRNTRATFAQVTATKSSGPKRRSFPLWDALSRVLYKVAAKLPLQDPFEIPPSAGSGRLSENVERPVRPRHQALINSTSSTEPASHMRGT